MSQIVLVTGCRSGFGLRIALRAAQAGHTVYAGLRDVRTAASLVRETEGLQVVPVQLDVTRPQERDAVVDRIVGEHGRIDALVNNAGVAVGGFLEDLSDDELRHMFEVNVFGAFGMTNAVLPAMRAQRRGTVIDISSTSGLIALPGLGGYAASKFALEGMGEARRHELHPFGVRYCLVEPGPFKTDIFGRNRRVAGASGPDSPYADMAARLESLVDKAVASAADPDVVARYVVDLLTARNPRLRHPMGPFVKPRIAAKRLLPFRVIEAVIGRVVG